METNPSSLSDEQLEAEIARLMQELQGMSPGALDESIHNEMLKEDPYAPKSFDHFSRDWLAKRDRKWGDRFMDGLSTLPEVGKYIYGTIGKSFSEAPGALSDPQKFVRTIAEGATRGWEDIKHLGLGIAGEWGDREYSDDEHIRREYERYRDDLEYQRAREGGLIYDPEEVFQGTTELTSIVADPTNFIPFTSLSKPVALATRAGLRKTAELGAFGARAAYGLGEVATKVGGFPRAKMRDFLTTVGRMHPDGSEGAALAGMLAGSFASIPGVSPVLGAAVATEGAGMVGKAGARAGGSVLSNAAAKDVSRRFLSRIVEDASSPLWVRRLADIARKSGGEWALDRAFNAIVAGVDLSVINGALQYAATGDPEGAGAGVAQGIAMAPAISLMMPGGRGLTAEGRVNHAVKEFAEQMSLHGGKVTAEIRAQNFKTFMDANPHGAKVLAGLHALMPELRLAERFTFLKPDEYNELFPGIKSSGSYNPADQTYYIKLKPNMKAVNSSALHEIGHGLGDLILNTNHIAAENIMATLSTARKDGDSGTFLPMSDHGAGADRKLTPYAEQFKLAYEYLTNPDGSVRKIKFDEDGNPVIENGDYVTDPNGQPYRRGEELDTVQKVAREMIAETIGELLTKADPAAIMGAKPATIRGGVLAVLSKMFSGLTNWDASIGRPIVRGRKFDPLDATFKGVPEMEQLFRNYIQLRKEHLDWRAQLHDNAEKLTGRDGLSARQTIHKVSPDMELLDPRDLELLGSKGVLPVLREVYKRITPTAEEATLGNREKGKRGSGMGVRLPEAIKRIFGQRLSKATMSVLNAIEEAIANRTIIDGYYSRRADYKGNNPLTYRRFLPYGMELSSQGNIIIRGWNQNKLQDAILMAADLGLVTAGRDADGKVISAADVMANRIQAASARQKEGLPINDDLVAVLLGARYGADTGLKDPALIEFARELNKRRMHPAQSLRLDTMQGFRDTRTEGTFFNWEDVATANYAGRSDRADHRASANRAANRALSSERSGVTKPSDFGPDSDYSADRGNPITVKSAQDYAESAGISYTPHTRLVTPPKSLLQELAREQENMPHNPGHSDTIDAYTALTQELYGQYEQLLNDIVPEAWMSEGQPYQNSREMFEDVRNGHLYFYRTTEGFGDGPETTTHPLLVESPYSLDGEPLLINDILRVVHDYYGHTGGEFQFGPVGEFNAYLAHAAMFSDKARAALAAETLTQNSWFNYGPHIDADARPGDPGYVHPADRPYAQQKATAVRPELLDKVHTSLDYSAERDASYMDAVDRGDMGKARELVDQAAKASGLVRSRHATGAKFTEFDRKKISDFDPDTNVKGFHFSNEADVTSSFRYQDSSKNTVMDVYLDLGRVIDRRTAQKMVSEGKHEDSFPIGFDTVVFRKSAGQPTKQQELDYDAGKKVDIPNTQYYVLKSQSDGGADLYYRDNPSEGIITGYLDLADAFAAHQEEHYVVKSPNQIKSADAITRDDAGNIIPLNQRFDSGQDDIRFSAERGPESKIDADYLKKLEGDKQAVEANLTMADYPDNPHIDGVALPARKGLVDKEAAGMPRSYNQVRELVENMVNRILYVAKKAPEYAKRSAIFYFDMADTALNLASSVPITGRSNYDVADLMLRFLALGSPRTGVAANASKSARSLMSPVGLPAGHKLGFFNQQTGAQDALATWQRGEFYNVDASAGANDKVRNFYLNGLAELIDIAMANGDKAEADILRLRAAQTLNLVDPGGSLGQKVGTKLDQFLDGLATVDMWDMAAKGHAHPAYILREKRDKTAKDIAFAWSVPKHRSTGKISGPYFKQAIQDIQKKYKKREVNGIEDLNWQEARALHIEGRDWNEDSWAARKKEPFSGDTQWSWYTKADEAGLSPGGSGRLYDAQQTIDGLIADRLNEMGWASFYGKTKLKARNAQEILWDIEKTANPLPANQAQVLFGDRIRPFAEAMESLRQTGAFDADPDSPVWNILSVVNDTYSRLHNQQIPFEVTSEGTTPIAGDIQRVEADIGAVELRNQVAHNLGPDLQKLLDQHDYNVLVESLDLSEGGFLSRSGVFSASPNILLKLRGRPEDTREVLRSLTNGLDQESGNLFRKPTIEELNNKNVLLNNVIVFDTAKLTPEQIQAFHKDLLQVTDSKGDVLFDGYTTLDEGMAIGDQWYGETFLREANAKKGLWENIMANHGVTDFSVEGMIVEKVFRGDVKIETPLQRDISRMLAARIQNSNRGPGGLEYKADRVARAKRVGTYGSSKKLEDAAIDSKASIDELMLEGQLTQDQGEVIKSEIGQLFKEAKVAPSPSRKKLQDRLRNILKTGKKGKRKRALWELRNQLSPEQYRREAINIEKMNIVRPDRGDFETPQDYTAAVKEYQKKLADINKKYKKKTPQLVTRESALGKAIGKQLDPDPSSRTMYKYFMQ